MNKKELIKEIGAKTGYTQKDITEVVECMLSVITDSLNKGDDVNLTGFGKFYVQERAAREARNPRTGETVSVGASKAPKFKAGKAFKDAIAG